MRDFNLDNLNDDEVDAIIASLEEQGYIIGGGRTDFKKKAIVKALRERGAIKPYIGQSLTKAIYQLADTLTDNYTQTPSGAQRGVSYLPKNAVKRQEYIRIVDGIIGVIYEYYNKRIYFREKEEVR